MDIAVREATRLDAIITEFLQYARPPALDLAEYDINKILAETLDLVQHEARNRKQITIVTSLAGGSLPGPMDQNQMRQVFWNLATNAFDAMPDGGKLTITTGSRHIDAGGRKGDVVEIAFQDTAKASQQENLDKIFLPFFTTKKARLGSRARGSASHRRSPWRLDQSGKPATAGDPLCGLPAPFREAMACGYGMRERTRGKDLSRR